MSVDERRTVIGEDVRAHHQSFNVSLARYVMGARPLVFLSAPFIYLVLVPLLLLDLIATLYQAICFPVYGVAKVKRAEFLIFDRAQLRYLNLLEKLNCAYCSYANGLIAYVREIAARTEQYWCPIKHGQKILDPHQNYGAFLDFGDAEAYRRDLERVRRQLGDNK